MNFPFFFIPNGLLNSFWWLHTILYCISLKVFMFNSLQREKTHTSQKENEKDINFRIHNQRNILLKRYWLDRKFEVKKKGIFLTLYWIVKEKHLKRMSLFPYTFSVWAYGWCFFIYMMGKFIVIPLNIILYDDWGVVIFLTMVTLCFIVS